MLSRGVDDLPVVATVARAVVVAEAGEAATGMEAGADVATEGCETDTTGATVDNAVAGVGTFLGCDAAA